MKQGPTKKEERLGEKLFGKVVVEFPELKEKQFIVPEQGWDHTVIVVGGKIVFRAPNPSENHEKDGDNYVAAFQHELGLMQYLSSKLSVPVPDYTYVASDRLFAGYPLVPGVTLTPQFFKKLNEPDQKRIAK